MKKAGIILIKLLFCTFIAANAQIQIDMDKALKPDKKGQTLLFKTQDINTLKYLLEHGADPNIKDNKGNTPLMNLIIKLSDAKIGLASETALNLYKLFLEHGADINIQRKGTKGKYALQMLIFEGNAQYFHTRMYSFKKLAACNDTTLFPAIRLFLNYRANPYLIQYADMSGTPLIENAFFSASPIQEEFMKENTSEELKQGYVKDVQKREQRFKDNANAWSPLVTALLNLSSAKDPSLFDQAETSAVTAGGQLSTGDSSASADNATQQQCAQEATNLWKQTAEYKNAINGIAPTMLNGEKAKLKMYEIMLQHCGGILNAKDKNAIQQAMKNEQAQVNKMQQDWNGSIKLGN